jgi:hypothetical protein
LFVFALWVSASLNEQLRGYHSAQNYSLMKEDIQCLKFVVCSTSKEHFDDAVITPMPPEMIRPKGCFQGNIETFVVFQVDICSVVHKQLSSCQAIVIQRSSERVVPRAAVHVDVRPASQKRSNYG